MQRKSEDVFSTSRLSSPTIFFRGEGGERGECDRDRLETNLVIPHEPEQPGNKRHMVKELRPVVCFSDVFARFSPRLLPFPHQDQQASDINLFFIAFFYTVTT